MECFYRATMGNHVGVWRPGEGHHMDWIRSYYAQPLRGRENEVLVVGRRGDGGEVTLRCTSDENDRIAGYVLGERRIEVAWCVAGTEQEMFQRFSSNRMNRP